MLKVYVPNISNTSIGGGWSFLRTLNKAFANDQNIQLVDNTDDYDILFSFAPTTIDGETIHRAKRAGKPFVLRMDGVPEDSRNSGRGTRRMVEYSLQADLVIFQSTFVRDTVGRMLNKNGLPWEKTALIYNGVDTDVFTPEGDNLGIDTNNLRIFHMSYRKDQNKRFEEVIAMFRQLSTYRNDVTLVLVGRYPTEWQQYGFGFFNGERVKYLGIIEDEAHKSAVMRSCDVFFNPSFADPAPNTVLEAMASGIPVVYNGFGGVAEYVGEAGIPIDYSQKNDTYLNIFRELKNDSVDLVEYKRRAREQAMRFSLAELHNRYASVFIEVASRGGVTQ